VITERTESGVEAVTGRPVPDGKQIDNRGVGGNVGDIIAWAEAAASVEVSQTKDGKPQAILPDGTRVKGYPEAKTAKGPTVEVRCSSRKVRVKARGDEY
jgi:hypothetical protein